MFIIIQERFSALIVEASLSWKLGHNNSEIIFLISFFQDNSYSLCFTVVWIQSVSVLFRREHSSPACWEMIYEEASYRRRRSRLWTNENHLSSIEDCVTWPTRGRRASVSDLLNPRLFHSGSPTNSYSTLQTPAFICKKSDSAPPLIRFWPH